LEGGRVSFGYMKVIGRHPAISGAAGAVIGWHAASGSLFAALLMAGSFAAFSEAMRQRRIAKATEAARAAAVAVGRTEICADPESIPCHDAASAAGIKAGMAIMQPLGSISSRLLMAAAVFGAMALFAVAKNYLS
jgi:hypothetical protein